MKTFIFSIIFILSYSFLTAQYAPNVSVETRGINWPNSAAENCNGSTNGYNPTLCPTYNVTGMNWYMSGITGQPFAFTYSSLSGIQNRDYAMVNGGVIEVRDPNSDICFNSPLINIAGLGTINMSFVCTRPGTGTTYVHVNFRYRVNGGAVVSSGNLTGGSGTTSSWSPSVTGNTLEIWACMNATGNNDVYNLTSMSTNLGGPLPLKWSGFFIAPTNDGHSHLFWQTLQEINNDYFEVERSVDGIAFDVIGRVSGSGNSTEVNNYEFIDESAKPGKNYFYRVKQVDYDGNYDYSIVLNLYIKGASLFLDISPNPVENEVKVEIEEPLESTLIIDVFALNGLPCTTMILEPGEYFKKVDLSSLPDGLYVLKSRGSDLINKKFVKSGI